MEGVLFFFWKRIEKRKAQSSMESYCSITFTLPAGAG